MATIARQEIIAALERLGQLAQAQGEEIELVLIGGALMVLAYETRLSTRDVDAVIRRLLQEFLPGSAREVVWQQVEPYLVPGSELKARYAFLDLWEMLYGED